MSEEIRRAAISLSWDMSRHGKSGASGIGAQSLSQTRPGQFRELVAPKPRLQILRGLVDQLLRRHGASVTSLDDMSILCAEWAHGF